ncbi:Golgi transport complex subunit 6 [Dimargaris xerosporica]|nr:Golgi transport complex subunit 6 [Dimargaris xerosporica]
MASLPKSSRDGPAHPITRKLRHLLDEPWDPEATHEALAALITSYQLQTPSPDSTAEATPHRPPTPLSPTAEQPSAPLMTVEWLNQQPTRLRPRLERQTLAWNRQYLDSFTAVFQRYVDLEDRLNALHADFSYVQSRYHQVHTKTLALAFQAEELLQQRQETADKRQLAEALLHRFSLTRSQQQLLHRALDLLTEWEDQFQHYSYASHRLLQTTITRSPTDQQANHTSPGLDSRAVGHAFDQWLAQVDALINEAFFQTISDIHTLHKHAQLILAQPSQRIGNDIFKQLSSYEDTIYNLLYQWVRAECELHLNVEEPTVTNRFRRAVSELKWKPVLFESVTSTIVTFRQEALVNAFYRAVMGTSGPYTSGSQRRASSTDAFSPRADQSQPLELHAADPLRYIGDMVAWVHQAHANEREWLDNVLTGSPQPGKGPSLKIKVVGNHLCGAKKTTATAECHSCTVSADINHDHLSSPLLSLWWRAPILDTTSASLSDQDLRRMLDQIMQGIATPLTTWIRQALISANQTPATALGIFHLLYFYRRLIEKASNTKAIMTRTLLTLSDEAKFRLFELLHQQAGDLLRQVDFPDPSTLEVLPVISEVVGLVDRLLGLQTRSFMAAAADSDSPDYEQVQQFEQELTSRLLTLVVQPALASCAEFVDTTATEFTPLAKNLYLLNTNCYVYARLVHARSGLMDHLSFIHSQTQTLVARVEHHLYHILADQTQLPDPPVKASNTDDGLDSTQDNGGGKANSTQLANRLTHTSERLSHLLAHNQLTEMLHRPLQQLTAVVELTHIDALVGPPSEPCQALAVLPDRYGAQVVLRNWLVDRVVCQCLWQYQQVYDAVQGHHELQSAEAVPVYTVDELRTLML